MAFRMRSVRASSKLVTCFPEDGQSIFEEVISIPAYQPLIKGVQKTKCKAAGNLTAQFLLPVYTYQVAKRPATSMTGLSAT